MKKLCKDDNGRLYYLDDDTGNKLYLDKSKKEHNSNKDYHNGGKTIGALDD
jgi:hypothetical protein